jgi:hypothetical protein
MKSYLSILLTFICYTHINAQDASSVTNYLQQAGIYADIYNGKREITYNLSQYENLPYYMNSAFAEASVFYRKNYYPKQKVRLDLFKEQLVILSPEKQYGIILDPQLVEKVQMYNKTFVWLIPPKESGLKTGYYKQLLDGRKMQLLCKENYIAEQKVNDRTAINYFSHKVRYYLSYNNQYHTVKNKGSFGKLFPQYKTQINSFVQDNQLDFKKNTEESLTSLAHYCEGLINSTNN